MATERRKNTSTWLALKNRVFVWFWIASLVSGCCVSAHDTAATWLMNSRSASPFLLSMMATSASLPFFVFTLPAGAISDVVNRQNLFIGTYLWLAGAAGLLAVCTWLNLVHPYLILVTVFLLGIGFAFNVSVWASIVPDIVRKEELAFGLFIAVVPALLPVVAFQHLHLAAIQLGLVFTSLGIGSLLGATLVLPYARTKATPNMLTILASLILVSVFIFTAIVPNLWIFLPVAALAGISWTMSASELWTAGR